MYFIMKKAILGIIASAIVPIAAHSVEAEIKCSFNADNVILPSSQYTPSQPYNALVWVYTGDRYDGANYNRILATPPTDSAGNEWYTPEYLPDEADPATWATHTAPFSSDEYYLGQRSYRWVEAEIMGEIYMRRTFTLTPDDIPAGFKVYLTSGHDDAPSEWYINGELVHSASDGWDNEQVVLLSDEQKALIKTDGSENLLAVHVHQNWGGAFADCGLYLADMSLTRTYLNTVADGAWPCAYYMLNYNSDFTDAESAKWYAMEENEGDWMKGVGPFSNDNNMFYTTEWPSQLRPILIRRHLTLTDADIADIVDSQLIFSCSYDEDPVAYLNGERLWSASGWNDNNYAEVVLTDEQKELFVNGDNVLAVSLKQGGGGGHIDYGLSIATPYNPSSGAGSVTEEARVPDGRIYNLHGQYLGTETDPLPAGLYIRDGKKFILRR